MISIYTTRPNRHTLSRLLGTWPELKRRVQSVTYDVLFRRLTIADGTAVFTDFDHLSGFEIDAAAEAAMALEAAGGRVINAPTRVAERFELLRRLEQAQLNPVEVVRLDDLRLPRRYPVFIRSEDGAFGPETGLLESEAAFMCAVETLRRQGRSLKRRIAVSFEAECGPDGFYRKFGALVIGDQIVPQHVLRKRDWNVKNVGIDRDGAFLAEERDYVRDNPHEADLLRIADVAGIGFGRIDYTIVHGRPVIFEINTNPQFPRFRGGDPSRQDRRDLIRRRLDDAFGSIDSGAPPGRPVAFSTAALAGFNFPTRSRRWYEDFPRSLTERRRWRNLAAHLGLAAEDAT